MSIIRQFSLLGAEASPPRPADLAGLLAANGQITRRDGGAPRVVGSLRRGPAVSPHGLAARVSVVVDHPWRASVLVAECARRGLAATCVATAHEHMSVRTAFSTLLMPLAQAWTNASLTRAPVGLMLDGHQLRLWAEAAGRCESATSYVLGLGRRDVPAGEPIGAALAAMGLRAQLIVPRGGRGSSYRIVGRRRITLLLELIGEPPGQTPGDMWPR
jgi:hypothetical protein